MCVNSKNQNFGPSDNLNIQNVPSYNCKFKQDRPIRVNSNCAGFLGLDRAVIEFVPPENKLSAGQGMGCCSMSPIARSEKPD